MHAPAHLRGVTAHAADVASEASGSAAGGAAATAAGPDPYLLPQTSTLNKLARVLWGAACLLLFRPSPRPMHAWRSFLLRCFGAKLGPSCHIYPGARIWAPWNLVCADGAAIADEAVIYNAAQVFLGSHAIVSQQAYVCTATHDFDDPGFPMLVAPIAIGGYAWVCARACVLPGVTLGDGAVLGLASVATKDLEPWQVYAGNPARRIKQRRRHTVA
jgi:putative colanic acid biosynthesis acetyltransferase WcaF